MTDRNDTTQSQVEDITTETVVDPWHKLQNGFKGIRLLKKPTRLKEIRDSAQQLKAEYKEQITKLGSQLTGMSDLLDKLTAQDNIKRLKDRISAIDNNLADITSRVKVLAKEYKDS